MNCDAGSTLLLLLAFNLAKLQTQDRVGLILRVNSCFNSRLWETPPRRRVNLQDSSRSKHKSEKKNNQTPKTG